MVDDGDVVSQLGEPLQVGRPFSQSSSTVVINGRSLAKVRARFNVVGPYGGGVATMESSDGVITNLVVNVNGRDIVVGSSGGGGGKDGRGGVFGYDSSLSSVGRGGNGGKKEDIIEAEIIEKK